MITRREFVSAATVAGAAAAIGGRPEIAAAEPPPETTKLRLSEGPILCLVPQYVADGLLRSEGFTDVRYVNYPRETQTWAPDVLVSGEVDLTLSFGPTNVLRIDAGAPIVMLAGSHNGCVELFGGRGIRSTRDLKGKTVAVTELRSDQHIFRAKATSTPSAPSLPRPGAPVPRPSRPQPARRPLEPQAQPPILLYR